MQNIISFLFSPIHFWKKKLYFESVFTCEWNTEIVFFIYFFNRKKKKHSNNIYLFIYQLTFFFYYVSNFVSFVANLYLLLSREHSKCVYAVIVFISTCDGVYNGLYEWYEGV